MNDILKEALKDVPVTKTDLAISSYGSVDLDELNKTVERLNKIPNMNDLVKENNQLQSNWNSLREYVEELYNKEGSWAGCGARYVLDKMNELEGKDKN